MKQFIESLNKKEIAYIQDMVIKGKQLAKNRTGKELTGKKQDLKAIQEIIDSGHVKANDVENIQALGVVFVQVIINEFNEYNWWVVESEMYRDFCIRKNKSDNFISPQITLAYYLIRGEKFDIQAIYDSLDLV